MHVNAFPIAILHCLHCTAGTYIFIPLPLNIMCISLLVLVYVQISSCLLHFVIFHRIHCLAHRKKVSTEPKSLGRLKTPPTVVTQWYISGAEDETEASNFNVVGGQLHQAATTELLQPLRRQAVSR